MWELSATTMGRVTEAQKLVSTILTQPFLHFSIRNLHTLVSSNSDLLVKKDPQPYKAFPTTKCIMERYSEVDFSGAKLTRTGKLYQS